MPRCERGWRTRRAQRQTVSAPVIIVVYTDTADALVGAEEVLHPEEAHDRRERARLSIERTFSGKSDDEREAWGAAQGYLALGFLLLAAESLGYQTSPMLGFDPEREIATFNLPAHVRVPALVAIGHGIEEGLEHHRHPLSRIARFL